MIVFILTFYKLDVPLLNKSINYSNKLTPNFWKVLYELLQNEPYFSYIIAQEAGKSYKKLAEYLEILFYYIICLSSLFKSLWRGLFDASYSDLVSFAMHLFFCLWSQFDECMFSRLLTLDLTPYPLNDENATDREEDKWWVDSW